jgi:hypothetical protein
VIHLTQMAVEKGAELMLPGGCILCGGDLAVRVTPVGAASCCRPCRWISRPRVVLSREGLQVSYQPAGQA